MSNSKKGVSLAEYYEQLSKTEGTRQLPLRKDNSLTGLKSNTLNSSSGSKIDRIFQDRYKPPQPQRQVQKQYQRRDYTTTDQFKRVKGSDFPKSAFVESLTASKVRSEKWEYPVEEDPPREGHFNEEEQEVFLQHCKQLYQCEGKLSSLTAQINKRDEVYQLVGQNLGQGSLDNPRKLREYFQQHRLLTELIDKFKRMGKLEGIRSMRELNIYLKSER